MAAWLPRCNRSQGISSRPSHKGPAFFAYSDNYLIDVKFGVIGDVEASRAIRQAEVGAARTMIERTEERFGFKPERLAAAKADVPLGQAGRSAIGRVSRLC